MGAHHGAVRDAGGLLGARLEPGIRRILLHPAWSTRPLWMDRAGRACLSDRCRQSGKAARGNLQGLLCDARWRVVLRWDDAVGIEQAAWLCDHTGSPEGLR